MTRDTTRRTVLGLAAGLVGVGTSAPLWTDAGATDGTTDDVDGGGPPTTANVSTDTTTIMAGTEHATTVYEKRAEADGPTVMVVGGVHGDETSGYRAAHDVRTWNIDAGTLVVLPEANKLAVERESRDGEHGDLNRKFPAGEQPTTKLARAIWAAVREYDPDVFLDLHQALGIYPGDPSGVEDQVGQAIFYAGDDSAPLARSVAETVNENVVPDSRPKYDFATTHFDIGMDPSGLLATKVALDLGARSYLVEVTSKDLTLEKRVEWTTSIVRQYLLEVGVLSAQTPTPTQTPEPTPDENDGPSASITTTPEDAESTNFEKGQTVTLDGSASNDPDGEVASYEWDLDDDGNFERSGPTVELTLDSCGTYPATLRVTDDDGATATETITLRTVTPR